MEGDALSAALIGMIDRRRWFARVVFNGWGCVLTLGVHLDPRHPILDLHLGPWIISIGCFYLARMADGTETWITVDLDE